MTADEARRLAMERLHRREREREEYTEREAAVGNPAMAHWHRMHKIEHQTGRPTWHYF